jgi:iron complex outermembrane receptor protein
VFSYIQNNAKLYGGEIGLHFHPHPWLHYETSFETVTGETERGLLPLIPANNWSNTIRTEFKIRNWFEGLCNFEFY